MKSVIPEKVFDQHLIVLGKTRSGKSSKLRLLVERLLNAGKPVCIIDPKGDWYGLKSSADGKSAGYPVVIFGGDHGDVPINEHAGAQVAEIMATGNRPCIIDLGGWTVGARTRFFIDFAQALFKLSRGQRHLVIDEVHNFAPQGKVFDVAAGKMLHWANRLASEGQGKGIILMAASQRPQKVHKDFVTSCETLIACRVTHILDRGATKDWIDGCADPAIGKQVMQDLASMDRSQAWVWSPEIDFGPEKITFPLFSTYDSFRPQPADAGPLTGWAAVDLEDVRASLAAAVEEAKDNDPSLLKQRIAELERELRKHVGCVTRTEAEALARDAVAVDRKQRNDQPVVDQSAVDALKKIAKIVQQYAAPESAAPAKPAATAAPSSNFVAVETTKPAGGSEKRVLNSLAWWESTGLASPYTKVQVAFVAGYKPGSGGFNNLLGKLRASGMIEYPVPGMVQITQVGLDAADPVTGATTQSELQNKVLSQLSTPLQKVLTEVIAAYPGEIAKTELAARAGYSAGSGGFNNLVGKLRSLSLIEYPRTGAVKACSFLFLERKV